MPRVFLSQMRHTEWMSGSKTGQNQQQNVVGPVVGKRDSCREQGGKTRPATAKSLLQYNNSTIHINRGKTQCKDINPLQPIPTRFAIIPIYLSGSESESLGGCFFFLSFFTWTGAGAGAGLFVSDLLLLLVGLAAACS